MTDRRSWLTGRLVFGIVVIWFGIMWTLDNLGVLDSGEILRWWPAALVAFGLIRLFQGGERSRRISGLVFTVVGFVLLLSTSDIFDFSIFDLWPLILIFIGASLIVGAIKRSNLRAGINLRSSTTGGREGDGGAPFVEVVAGIEPDADAGPGNGGSTAADPAAGESAGKNQGPSNSSDRINTFTLMGATGLKSVSKRFQGGDVTALLGGAEVDFRHARTDRDRIYLDLFAFCGGIDIFVPEDWQVESEVVPIMGGIEDKTKPPAGPVHTTLVLRGGVVWGGIEVKN